MKQCSFLNPILVAVLGSAALSANAAESVKTNSIVVTLDAVVADALEKNPELKFYEAEIAAAKGGRKTAGLPGNPEVNGAIGEKSVMLGVIDVGEYEVEGVESLVGRVRQALAFVPKGQLILAPDCGMLELSRASARAKLVNLGLAARAVNAASL